MARIPNDSPSLLVSLAQRELAAINRVCDRLDINFHDWIRAALRAQLNRDLKVIKARKKGA